MHTLNGTACRSLTRLCARTGALAQALRHVLVLVAFVLALNLDVGSSQPGRGLRDLLLPPDAKAVCPFAASELADWFQAGRVEADGVVRPPNSMTVVPGSPHCDFFKWAARTFLWVTSTGEGGGMTFESPEFFAIAAPDQHGMRTLSRGSVEGSEARGGVNYAGSSGGKPVESTGQPGGGGGLMAQNGSLVYVANHVNDVFAYFMTGQKKGEIPLQRVPATASDLQKVIDYAQSKGVQFAHPNTLTMVVKSAWIEATGLDESKYITINATVPTFDTANPARWTRNGEKKATLALVGMHIAGGLPFDASMIWATFEHIANSPVGGFSYLGPNGETRTAAAVDGNPDGGWNFSGGDCAAGTHKARMVNRTGVLEARSGETIGPINTCRTNAWGAPAAPASPVENNTRIIDVNRHSFGQLPRDDVRSSYVLVGATWNLGDGSKVLANTTLETFTQETGCLSCHVGNLTTGLNRMWPKLQPLP